MWSNRPVGQLEKCAEAGALRRAFPEEIGNALAAEEMEGQHTLDGAAQTPEKPKPEASRPRLPEGNANLSRRSCRNHSPSPPRHRPSFPNRSPPGKKTIPKSPMPSRPLRNEDDIRGVRWRIPINHALSSVRKWGGAIFCPMWLNHINSSSSRREVRLPVQSQSLRVQSLRRKRG